MSSSFFVKLIFASISGFILSFGAPGYDLWFIPWIGLVPLFVLIETSKNIKEAFIYPFTFGFFYNSWYLHWLPSMHSLGWLGLSESESIFVSYLSYFMVVLHGALFFVLYSFILFIIKKFSLNPFPKGLITNLIYSFLWLVVFNKIYSIKAFLGFPWTLVEYSQYKNLFLIQVAEFFGSTFISFLIVLFNIVLAEIFLYILNAQKIGNRIVSKDLGQFGNIVFSFSFVIILISASISVGGFLFYKNKSSFSKASKTVCVLQGNLPIKATRGGVLDKNISKMTYENLIYKNEATLFIASEGALPVSFNSAPNAQNWLKQLSYKKQAGIIFGTYCDYPEKPTNCAVCVSPTKKEFLFYEKQRLVPFGEFIPLSFLFPSILQKLSQVGLSSSFKEGKKNSPVQSAIGKVGLNICFESIFPTLIRKLILKGANLLVNLSDLSWFSNERVRQQFLGFAVFRAIENRKPFVISANNGTSAFVDINGEIKSQTTSNTEGVLIDWIIPNNKLTFYTRYGW